MGRLEYRQRNRGNRQRKSIVAIGCEGKNKTETIYFKNFSSRECNIRFSTGNHTDPVGMANDLVQFIKEEDISSEYDDKVYLLIDTDVNQKKQAQLNEAKGICEKNRIELITSTPTFEIWYRLHYGFSTKIYQNSKQVKEEMNDKIENYSESMDVFQLLKDKTGIAIENAKKLEKYQKENGQVLGSENCNPYTAVYKVVEELIHRNLNNEK